MVSEQNTERDDDLEGGGIDECLVSPSWTTIYMNSKALDYIKPSQLMSRANLNGIRFANE